MMKIAIAGRYLERAEIRTQLAQAGLLHAVTASWLDSPAEGDSDLSEAQARLQVETNVVEILNADLLLYVPSWGITPGLLLEPYWSPGRLIDVGIAIVARVPVLIVGKPESSIYFRGMPVCDWGTVRETVEGILHRKVEG